MENIQHENYLQLMKVIRRRFDVIKSFSDFNVDNSEIAAFHGRKIIEGIAFGCLIATKNGLKEIPKDAQGQYNAEKILKTLIRKGIEVFPSPSQIQRPSPLEKENNIDVVIAGIPDRRITKEELIKKYQRMHTWLHELNPYTKEGQQAFFEKNQEQLRKDLNDLDLFLASHLISLNGEAFFCTLKDKLDGETKVVSMSKISDIS